MIPQVVGAESQPKKQQSLNGLPDRAGRRDKNYTRRCALFNERVEMHLHCLDVGCNKGAIIVGRYAENFGIGSSVRNESAGFEEINRRLAASKATRDVRIQARVGQKPYSQLLLVIFSALARSKRSMSSGGQGLRALNSSNVRSWSFR